MAGHEIWTQTSPRSSDTDQEYDLEDDLVVHLSKDPTPRPTPNTNDIVKSLHIGRTPTPNKRKRPPRVEKGRNSTPNKSKRIPAPSPEKPAVVEKPPQPPKPASKWPSAQPVSPASNYNQSRPVFHRSKTDYTYLIKPSSRPTIPMRQISMRQTLPTNLTSTYDVDSLQTEELSLFGDATGIPVLNGTANSRLRPPPPSSSKSMRYPSAPASDQSSYCAPPPKMSVMVETRPKVFQAGQMYGQTISQTIGESQGGGEGLVQPESKERPRPHTHPAQGQSQGQVDTPTSSRRCDACTVGSSVKQQSERSPRSSDGDVETSDNAGEARHSKEDGSAKPFYEPLQLLRTGTELSHMYHVQGGNGESPGSRSARERVSLHTVSLPRRGLIKLTGLPYEMADPAYYDNRKARAEEREHVTRWLESAGPPLPASRGDPRKSCLIRDRTMIKQVKHGHRRLLKELAEREKGEMSEKLLNSLVTGLLQYQIPEVPNMNKNMQSLVEPEIQRLDLRLRSQSATTSGGQGEWLPRESTSLAATEVKHSALAYKNYITSPRSGFDVGDRNSSRGSSATTVFCPRIEPSRGLSRKSQRGRPLGETRRLRADDQFNLHKLLANAKKFHFRGLGDLPKDKILDMLGGQY